MLNKPIYYGARFICWVGFKLLWRLKVQGLENVPQEGGVIFAANHRSYTDPPLMGVSIPREVHFIAKKELFDFKPFGWLISNMNAHPLDRAGDIGAFKMGLKFLEQGFSMIIFPEGRRQRTDEIGEGKAGVGLLSSASGCPVVPTYIHNSGHIFEFKKLTVTFGRPVRPEGKSKQEITQEVMREIRRLKEEVSRA